MPRGCLAASSATIGATLCADPVPLREGVSIRHVLDTSSFRFLIRLAVDPTTGDLYTLHRDNGSIWRIGDLTGDPTRTLVYSGEDTGLDQVTWGFTFGPDGTLYVVGNDLDAGPLMTRAEIRRGVRVTPGGDEREWSTVATTVPYPRSGGPFDHYFNGIVVDPTGRFLFVNSGSRTDHGELADGDGLFPGEREVPLTSAIFRIPVDTTDLELPNDASFLRDQNYLHADGVRNSFDLAFAPNGDLFATENAGERDDSEELNWIRQGHHYGFPWRLGTSDTPMQNSGYVPLEDRLLEPGVIPNFDRLFYDDPEYPAPPPGLLFSEPVMNEGPDADRYRDPETGAVRDGSDDGVLVGTFTAHRSPLGVVFDVDRALAPDFSGDGFVLAYTPGDADGDEGSGPFFDGSQDLLHLELTKNQDGGNYRVRATRLVTGFDRPIDSVLIDNRLYVLEYSQAGELWEVTLPPRGEEPIFRRGLVNPDGDSDIGDAVFLLLYLFAGAGITCEDAADVNDDGSIDVSDPIALLGFLFLGSGPPGRPYAECGPDPSPDGEVELGCVEAPGC